MFDLEPLQRARRRGERPVRLIDKDRLDKGEWHKPIAIPEVDVSAWPMSTTCNPSSAKTTAPPNPIHVTADEHPELIAQVNLRGEIPAYRKAIRDFLKQHH